LQTFQGHNSAVLKLRFLVRGMQLVSWYVLVSTTHLMTASLQCFGLQEEYLTVKVPLLQFSLVRFLLDLF